MYIFDNVAFEMSYNNTNRRKTLTAEPEKYTHQYMVTVVLGMLIPVNKTWIHKFITLIYAIAAN